LVLNQWFTHTSTVAELPQVYHLFTCQLPARKTEHLVLEEAPIATPKLTKKVTTANFTQADPDALSAAFHHRRAEKNAPSYTHIGAYMASMLQAAY
jgi:hypothetical protein